MSVLAPRQAMCSQGIACRTCDYQLLFHYYHTGNTPNNFFINIGPTLAKSIPFIDKSPLNSMGDRILESLYLQPVTCEEINNILVSLKNTACGWDDISSVFLKLSTQQILQPLSHICVVSTEATATGTRRETGSCRPKWSPIPTTADT